MEIKKELKFKTLNQGFDLAKLPIDATEQARKTENYFKRDKDGKIINELISSLPMAEKFFAGTLLRNLRGFYKLDQNYLYDKTCGIYRPVSKLALDVIIRRIGKEAKLTLNANLRKTLLVELKSLSTQFDLPLEDPVLIMANGTFDLETLNLSPWTPQNFVINQIPYDYVKGATCPRFHKFLKESFPDEEMIPFIRKR